MKLIIDISEETYNAVIGDEWIDSEYIYNIINSIQNGTPLPKGHGRLGDLDQLERIMYRKAFETDSDMQKWDSGCWIRYKMFENSMEEMPTIIEADKGE